MLKITQRLEKPVETDYSIKLTYEIRQKSRFKAKISDGTEVGVFLSIGYVLRNGDCLMSEDGRAIEVIADDETLSIVHSDDALQLSKACYHLGNRHVALQIQSNKISYLHDHVLDDMIKGLGLTVSTEEAPFEPESGAYSNHQHSQSTHSHHH